jgi:hypothetical protein
MITGRRIREALFSSLSYSYCFTRGRFGGTLHRVQFVCYEVGCEQIVSMPIALYIRLFLPPLAGHAFRKMQVH